MTAIINSADQGVYSIVWSPIANGDTVTPTYFKGGPATIMVEGTFSGAAVQMLYGSDASNQNAIDTNEHPAGAKFTSPGVCNVNLAAGFISASVLGGTAGQNIKITVRRIKVET